MKLPRLLLAFACLALATLVSAAADAGRVFEMRTYYATPGKRDAMLARFRDHTVKLFEKHGMKNVGYWIPADDKDGGADKLVYLLEHKSREAAAASWKAFSADPQWQDVRKKSEAAGRIVAKVESIFLKETDYSKPMTAGARQGGKRVFEMRTYTTNEGKLDALDARFRDHTVKLFEKHGMTNLGYFHPVDADKGAKNTLIYFLAHPSREAAAKAFGAFRENPDWVKARTASEKNGKLTSAVKSEFLIPTDFSPLK